MIAPMTKYSFILLSGMQDSQMDTLQSQRLSCWTASSRDLKRQRFRKALSRST